MTTTTILLAAAAVLAALAVIFYWLERWSRPKPLTFAEKDRWLKEGLIPYKIVTIKFDGKQVGRPHRIPCNPDGTEIEGYWKEDWKIPAEWFADKEAA